MKIKLAAGLLLAAGILFAAPSVRAQELGDDILEKLEAIEATQQEILAKLDAVASAQNEQKTTLEEIERKQKAYVNPKWTP